LPSWNWSGGGSPRGIDLDGVGVAWSPRGVGIAVALPDGVGVVRSLCRHGIGAVAGPLSTKRCSLHHRRIRERICAECLRPFAGSPRGIDLDGVGVAWSPRGIDLDGVGVAWSPRGIDLDGVGVAWSLDSSSWERWRVGSWSLIQAGAVQPPSSKNPGADLR
jgi:hypothetical protein